MLSRKRLSYSSYSSLILFFKLLILLFALTVQEIFVTIGFVKEAPLLNIHGFNVYHKHRLILVSITLECSNMSSWRQLFFKLWLINELVNCFAYLKYLGGVCRADCFPLCCFLG